VPVSSFTPPRLLQPLLLRGMGALVGGGSRLGTTPLLATAVNERLLLANTLYERIRKKHAPPSPAWLGKNRMVAWVGAGDHQGSPKPKGARPCK
jgi:hypothetical protein